MGIPRINILLHFIVNFLTFFCQSLNIIKNRQTKLVKRIGKSQTNLNMLIIHSENLPTINRNDFLSNKQYIF